jgi:hypothetical protein
MLITGNCMSLLFASHPNMALDHVAVFTMIMQNTYSFLTSVLARAQFTPSPRAACKQTENGQRWQKPSDGSIMSL